MHGYGKECEVNQGDSKTLGCEQKLVIVEGDKVHDGNTGKLEEIGVMGINLVKAASHKSQDR